MKSTIYPESEYVFRNLSLDEIDEAYDNYDTITGIVDKIVADKGVLSIQLGEDIYGELPFHEVTIYPLTYSSNPNRPIPIQICTLLHKTIRCKIVDFVDGVICLSRKDNMIQAYQYLSTVKSVMFHITGMSQSMAFGDIGDGIVGKLHVSEVCKARIRNIAEYFHLGNKIWVNITGKDENKNFFLSYKDTFPQYDPSSYHYGDVYVGNVCEALNAKRTGYFINISPQVSGIMDANTLTPLLQYGDRIEVVVCKADERGLKLKFSKLLN